MQIGDIKLKNRLIAAPMAGVSDRPFRELCYRFGAGMAVSEMLSSNPMLWDTDKSLMRTVHINEPGIRAVQILGNEPQEMAHAAKMNVKHGAQLIDINMGCPAKKVNKKVAGSALMQYPTLVADILHAVVDAVTVPVTLKIRTGWDKTHKNCLEIAKIAQECGIQALTIHGRTRTCLFSGQAEYETIKIVKQNVSIPIIANGDICDPAKAQRVLEYTRADALMIGRGAQGKPWIFEEIQYFLETGKLMPPKPLAEVKQVILAHVKHLHQFYGEYKGLRIARKHVAWYLTPYVSDTQFRHLFNAIEHAYEQLDVLDRYLDNL